MNERGIKRELEMAEQELDALLHLSESLGNISQIEGSLHELSKRMTEVFRTDRCSIILLGEEDRRGYVAVTSSDPVLQNRRIDLYANPEFHEALSTLEPLMISDAGKNPLCTDDAYKSYGNTILFPMRITKSVQGILMLSKWEMRGTDLTSREIRYGKIVANSTGIAIRNAKLYETIRDRGEQHLSERLKAEKRLRQIEKYQRFFDFAGDGLIIVDGSGRILFANRAAQKILGFNEMVISRIKLSDLVEPSGQATLNRVLESVRSGRHERNVDVPVLRSSGDVAILSMTTASLEDSTETGDLPTIHPNGEPLEDAPAIISFRNVTETRRMEEELRRTKDFLSNVIDSSADAIVASDMTGEILIFNEIAERITGYKQAEVLGMNVAKLYPPGVAKEIMVHLRSEDHDQKGKLQDRRQNLLTRAGDLVPVNLAAAIVYNEEGEEVATVGIFSDLRELLRMEDQLQKAQQELELSATQAAVVELAGAAAHELNQPLTTIIGSVELLMRKTKVELVVTALNMILSEADRMAEIVSKLGRITKYQTKHYLGETEILDLDAASNKED